MIKYPRQRVRRIVRVFQFLPARKAIGLNIHINIHLVLHLLLPPIRLCMAKTSDQNAYSNKTHVFHHAWLKFEYQTKIGNLLLQDWPPV
jgi:hypothetical protein